MPRTTLLLDLDGVLRSWPKDYSDLEAEHGLPAGSIGRIAFEPLLLEQVITGRITDDAWRDDVRRRLAQAHPRSRAEAAVTAWSEPAGLVNHEVLDLIVQARTHCKVGLVTNATDRLPGDLEILGLADHFDFIVNSSEVGFAKPNPTIFTLALSRASALPSEAAFVDDTPSNVATAKALGISTHHFVTVAGLREFMQSIRLSPNATEPLARAS